MTDSTEKSIHVVWSCNLATWVLIRGSNYLYQSEEKSISNLMTFESKEEAEQFLDMYRSYPLKDIIETDANED